MTFGGSAFALGWSDLSVCVFVECGEEEGGGEGEKGIFHGLHYGCLG